MMPPSIYRWPISPSINHPLRGGSPSTSKSPRQISSVRERRSFWGQRGQIYVLWGLCWIFLSIHGGKPGPLFSLQDDSPLHRAMFVQQVQAALSASGLVGSNFNGHSFRIGAATSRALQVCQNRQLRFLDAWHTSTTSALPLKIWQKYHRISADWARGNCVFMSVCLGAWLIKCVGWSYYGSLDPQRSPTTVWVGYSSNWGKPSYYIKSVTKEVKVLNGI